MHQHKPHFLSNLKVESRPGNYWLLLEPLCYVDSKGREWKVPSGFLTDFASFPALNKLQLRWLVDSDRAAVLHDMWYRWGELTRREADKEFRIALIAGGVPRWRAWVMWAAVRAFGWMHYNPQTKPIYDDEN